MLRPTAPPFSPNPTNTTNPTTITLEPIVALQNEHNLTGSPQALRNLRTTWHEIIDRTFTFFHILLTCRQCTGIHYATLNGTGLTRDLAELKQEMKNVDLLALDQDMVDVWIPKFARIEKMYKDELTKPENRQCPPKIPGLDFDAWARFGPQSLDTMAQSTTSPEAHTSQPVQSFQELVADRREERDGSPTPRGRGERGGYRGQHRGRNRGYRRGDGRGRGRGERGG